MQQVATAGMVSLVSLSELGLAAPEVTTSEATLLTNPVQGLFQIFIIYKILHPRN